MERKGAVVMTAATGRSVGVDEGAGWGDGLDELHARIAGRFARREPRARARGYLQGLLGGVERKNGWQLAEALGERTPDGVQRLLNAADWDADLVRDDLRAYVVEHLGDAAGVLIVDETGFVKKGTKSVGVARQYSGTAGRVENCQIGVFLAYTSPRGRAFLDRELYLHREWADDPERRREAGVPEEVAFATKPELARRMLARALDAGVPAAWVTGDEVYGGDRRLRDDLEARRRPYVLAVKRNEYVPVPDRAGRGWPVAADEAAVGLGPDAWQHLSAGDGAKGPRMYDWARVTLVGPGPPGWAHWLLVRRSRTDRTALAYYIGAGPTDTALATLARVAGARWAVEDCLEAAKGEVGLDQYEVRQWLPWYRHVTLALLAHAYLAVLRAHAGANEQKGGADSNPAPKTCSP
jgi:SRSO17 transposase